MPHSPRKVIGFLCWPADVERLRAQGELADVIRAAAGLPIFSNSGRGYVSVGQNGLLRIRVPVTEDEHAAVKRDARAHRKTMSEFLRDAAGCVETIIYGALPGNAHGAGHTHYVHRRFSIDQARAIRALHQQGASIKRLARAHRVDRNTIRQIVQCRSYKNNST